jgi:Immunoglobulin-like domain of bacterial spore germination/Sporulation and spore germination
MSYEKKIKDLLSRLVSMSPEPPPYPEELTMAAHEKPRSRPNPVLMFAAGAALVAAVMIPVILLTGGSTPVGVGTTTTTGPVTTTIPDVATTTSPETTSTTTPPTSSTTEEMQEVTWSGVVFLYQEPENSFLSNPALVPLNLEVTGQSSSLGSDDPFTSALTAMGSAVPDGFHNGIPGDVAVESVTNSDTVGGVIVADMSESFLSGAGGLLADTTMLNQLIYTLTIDDPTADVLFTVAGGPVEAFGSEGIVLTDPVDRDTFVDDLAPIFLTQPVAEFEGLYDIVGRANTFEAALTLQVLDGSGEVTHEEPLMATCGSGCWGEFGTGLAADLIVPGESSIRLFTYSAKDGSITESVTVPVPSPLVWQVAVTG